MQEVIMEETQEKEGVGRVTTVSSPSIAAQLAWAGKPFAVKHTLGERLAWSGTDAAEVLLQCPLASTCAWHALLSPDGVVGAYDRRKWGVRVTQADEGVKLHWRPLARQVPDFIEACSRPRHVITADCRLDVALSFWKASRERRSDSSEKEQDDDATCDPPGPQGSEQEGLEGAAQEDHLDLRHFPFVYLRGALPQQAAAELLEQSIFDELLGTGAFGGKDDGFAVTLYASSSNMQTNLHADEHGGFLVQVLGWKRVVLFDRAASRTLRCQTWGRSDAPVHRRSWFDNGVPDSDGWHLQSPFAGKRGIEVCVGPGDALYIPKGYFHDVLSRSDCTMGIVLRCR